jgi:hypothetical protein
MAKCNICKIEEGKGKRNICRHCWRKEHTAKNRLKLKNQAQARYLKNREHRMGLTKTWRQRNKEHVAELERGYYYKNNTRHRVRKETYRLYHNLLKTTQCDNCGSKDKLEFHHPEPYKIDNFVVLCFNCHRVLHGKLFGEFAKDWSSYSKQEQGVNHD